MNSMDEQAIIADLKQFLHQQDRTDIISDDQPLDLDSLLMLLTITHVEEELSIKLDISTLDFDSFSTLKGLAELIMRARDLAG